MYNKLNLNDIVSTKENPEELFDLLGLLGIYYFLGCYIKVKVRMVKFTKHCTKIQVYKWQQKLCQQMGISIY